MPPALERPRRGRVALGGYTQCTPSGISRPFPACGEPVCPRILFGFVRIDPSNPMLSLKVPLFLKVPFAEKEAAKALGARWSAERRQWYVPAGLNVDPLRRWLPSAAAADQVTDQPGQASIVQAPQQSSFLPDPPPPHHGDRVELFVDMVPTSAWFSNLRSELAPAEWDAVKKKTYQLAGHRCQACSGRGPRHPVEAHERWDFNGNTGMQTLLRVIALCPACHEATHFGLASLNGRARQAKDQLMKVAGMTELQANRHVREAMETYRVRSSQEWTLDARWLIDFVPLSRDTTEKILVHSKGGVRRQVQTWQQARIGDQHRRMKSL